MPKKEFTFEVVNILGEISEGSKGWKKELTRVSWNGMAPKYDVREWDEEHKKMGKGITLTNEELRKLKDLLVAEVKFLDENE